MATLQGTTTSGMHVLVGSGSAYQEADIDIYLLTILGRLMGVKLKVDRRCFTGEGAGAL